MTPEGVIMLARKSGVVLGIEGESISASAGPGGLDEVLRTGVRKHKTALLGLIETAWWPADRPRPSVMSLGTKYGAVPTTAALAALGCDLAVRTPTWEELFVVALQLEGGAP